MKRLMSFTVITVAAEASKRRSFEQVRFVFCLRRAEQKQPSLIDSVYQVLSEKD